MGSNTFEPRRVDSGAAVLEAKQKKKKKEKKENLQSNAAVDDWEKWDDSESSDCEGDDG